MYSKPIIDIKYKSDNWKDFPEADRLRCQCCNGIYWRLWEDVAQCMGCRSFTGFELNGPTGTMKDVKWAEVSLQSDTRIRDPISGKSEWVIFRDRLRARGTGQELILEPTVKGTWLMSPAVKLAKKLLNSKDVISAFKKSNALKNRKRK